jgi:sigma-B regulation protein RsbU (phosphoserine phosphatase)
VRAVLAVPLMVNNRITGMLAVTESRPGRPWSPNDQQLLSIVAGHSAAAIEQARLRSETMLKRELEEKNRRMEEELERARETQMTLVPSEPLHLGPWLAVGRIIPARAVGGDAFDFYPLSDTRFAVAIADVSGKGIPAALLMSNVVASVRAFCNGRSSIPDAIRFVNRGFTRTVASGKFITLFYGELDVAEGVFRFVNAGHNPPLLRRHDGSIERLTEGGVPIGLFEEWDYIQGEIAFRPGDALLLYSDGVTEAFDAFGGEYGEQRLERLWQRLGDGAPAAIVDATLEDVANFRGLPSRATT